jgi:hypothetical protein
LLHAKRFHIEGVPKLVLAEHAVWDRGLSDSLGSIDNAIEHLVIVPLELKLNPERKDHWEAVMHDVSLGLPYVSEGELPLAVCLHWTFLRQVLPGSPHLDRVREIAIEHALLGMADRFADVFLSVLASKEEMVRQLFHAFPELPKRHAAFDYISKSRGTGQEPIS